MTMSISRKTIWTLGSAWVLTVVLFAVALLSQQRGQAQGGAGAQGGQAAQAGQSGQGAQGQGESGRKRHGAQEQHRQSQGAGQGRDGGNGVYRNQGEIITSEPMRIERGLSNYGLKQSPRGG